MELESVILSVSFLLLPRREDEVTRGQIYLSLADALIFSTSVVVNYTETYFVIDVIDYDSYNFTSI